MNLHELHVPDVYSIHIGCDENSDLENSDPKNSDALGVSKTQTQKLRPSGCLENSDPKNSDPLGVSKTQTRKTQTLWVSRKLRPSVYVPLYFDRHLTL